MSARSSLAAALATVAVVGCTVDQLVGLTDAGGRIDGGTCVGTCTCPGSAPSCDFVCGAQTCELACAQASECHGSCDAGTCSFGCEGASGCTPTCSDGPCTATCSPGGEEEGTSCTLSCVPAQACAIDCQGSSCTVVCGALRPATRCDAGVYTCSAACP